MADAMTKRLMDHEKGPCRYDGRTASATTRHTSPATTGSPGHDQAPPGFRGPSILRPIGSDSPLPSAMLRGAL